MEGRKYRTLLPSLADSLVVEEELKCRLNRCAFDAMPRGHLPMPRGHLHSTTHTDIPMVHVPVSIPLSTAPLAPLAPLASRSGASGDAVSSGSASGSESIGSSPGSAHVGKRHRARSGERRHVCMVCLKGFTTSGHLARHNRIHTGEKNHSCPYEGCDQKFSRHDNCIQHYRTHLKREARSSST
ncbi:related to Probable transcriptional regulator NRG2 [Zygosaccharomyces bailii]|nr:related to transcriptional regulator NRG2 [Zygosaccharomyces bailii ISA1307]SJM83751.1 related to Probable transcriptional regulator NRG2 [Zygosaccharomyces bailii]